MSTVFVVYTEYQNGDPSVHGVYRTKREAEEAQADEILEQQTVFHNQVYGLETDDDDRGDWDVDVHLEEFDLPDDPRLVDLLRHFCMCLDMSDVDHPGFRDSGADVIEFMWGRAAQARALLAAIDAPSTTADPLTEQVTAEIAHLKTETNWYQRRSVAEIASQQMAKIAKNLRSVDATQAAKAVTRARKSVDGAARHADGHFNREVFKREREARREEEKV